MSKILSSTSKDGTLPVFDQDLANLRASGLNHELGARHDGTSRSTSNAEASPLIDVAGIIRTWFHELSLRYHPDRGGSTK
jgi:hypothetical protein